MSKTAMGGSRTWLEAHGWRWMGHNKKQGVSYYANLNLNTTETFPAWLAEEITKRLMFAFKTGTDIPHTLLHLGVRAPRPYDYPTLCALARALHHTGVTAPGPFEVLRAIKAHLPPLKMVQPSESWKTQVIGLIDGGDVEFTMCLNDEVVDVVVKGDAEPLKSNGGRIG